MQVKEEPASKWYSFLLPLLLLPAGHEVNYILNTTALFSQLQTETLRAKKKKKKTPLNCAWYWVTVSRKLARPCNMNLTSL